MKKSIAGKVLIALGGLLVLAALSLVAWNMYRSYSADKAAKGALSKLLAVMPTTIDAGSEDAKVLDENTDDGYVPSIEVDGKLYIGVVYIPSTNTELPVLNELTNDNLNIAPCRYYGNVKRNNLIIAAHNYATFFDHLEELTIGDEVIFVTADGVRYTYEVTELDLIGGANGEKMRSGFDSWDLTLFTCTWSGRSRVTVRAVLKK